jgi:hypothetical protein
MPHDDHPGHYVEQLNLSQKPDFIRPLIDQQLNATSPSVVVSVARSGDISIPQLRENFEDNLAYLAGHAGLGEVAFMTPDEAVKRYRSSGLHRKSRPAAV